MIRMSQILSKVRELLSDRNHWCKNHLYNGPACCLYGAWYKSRKSLGLDWREDDEKFARALGFHSRCEALNFNDSCCTTHADLIDLLDCSILKAQAAEGDHKAEIALTAHKSMTAQAK